MKEWIEQYYECEVYLKILAVTWQFVATLTIYVSDKRKYSKLKHSDAMWCCFTAFLPRTEFKFTSIALRYI